MHPEREEDGDGIPRGGVEFGRVGQATPQAPQLVRVVSGVSQPSVRRLPLQSPKPVSQVPLQALAAQLGVRWLVEHAMPHPPQWSGSMVVRTSHPSTCLLPLQSA